ncbi:MAG TPA: tol-pal system protein YbgF [Casimicrobiaceae bacterium]|nr:tol-pal system protein YbgF [Casimicrobiaceae bacterium]
MMRFNPRHAALALVMVANVAHAALFDDDEARRRIATTNLRLDQVQRQLEDRLSALETQLKSGGLVDLANQLELARTDMAKLRGQIEVLSYELQEAQKRQRDLYVDLDSRMRKVEGVQAAQASAAAAAAAAPPPAPQPPPDAQPPTLPPIATTTLPPGATSTVPPGPVASLPSAADRAAEAAREQRAYDAALDLFKRGDYSGAITSFGTFVRAYPRTLLAPSAQYWIGNAHFARRDFRAAITAQRTLIANYPDSSKVPDALLNIASAQGELGDNAGARRTLEELVSKYPRSEAADRAKQRLAGR